VNTPGVSQKFIQVDEEGYFAFDGIRVTDEESGRLWLGNLKMDDRGRAWTTVDGEPILVEAFDEPFIAVDVEKSARKISGQGGVCWKISMPYAHDDTFLLSTLRLDEWDRFHGHTESGVPFVFSRSAQARFFNLVDEFDDDAIVVDGERFETRPWLEDNPDISQDSWWSNIYRTEEPRWDLHEPARALPKLVPQLKLQKSRVLVPGAGAANDAAWFAEQGHIVTAVDFSEEAIARGKERYGHLPNLTFVRADIFDLPVSMFGNFDIIFDHTLYCAILPSRRTELVKVWRKLLVEHGHLMGVFFAMDKPNGPPYGGSEWELRSRLQKSFRSLYWMRLRDSIESRLGHEFFIYAQKRSATSFS
jgi:hypothetical protein